MLFVNAKGQAEKSLNREQVEYRKCYQEALSSAEALLDIRHEAVQILHECEAYLQKVTDHPYKYDLKSRKVNKDFQELEKKLKNYKEHKSGAGFLLGTGVAVLGPNVMLAAATTFGTASTGAAISSLGGAAAVNAGWAAAHLRRAARASWAVRHFSHWLARSALRWLRAALRQRDFLRRPTREKHSR